MTTTPGKPLPRFVRPGRGGGADEVVRPIAPTLVRLAAETEQAKRHEALATRYGEARTKLVALGTKLEEARRVDLAEERAAAEAGRKAKPAKAEKVEQELDEARRELEVLAELIEESPVALLAAVVPFLPQADEQARAAVEGALTEAHDALLAARSRFDEAATLAAESGWIASLRRDGTVAPWKAVRGADPTPLAASAVRQALAAFDEDRRRTAEHIEKAAREREVDEKLKLPAGRVVWREGQSFVVSEDGSLVEVER
jgi:hypothetical protein